MVSPVDEFELLLIELLHQLSFDIQRPEVRERFVELGGDASAVIPPPEIDSALVREVAVFLIEEEELDPTSPHTLSTALFAYEFHRQRSDRGKRKRDTNMTTNIQREERIGLIMLNRGIFTVLYAEDLNNLWRMVASPAPWLGEGAYRCHLEIQKVSVFGYVAWYQVGRPWKADDDLEAIRTMSWLWSLANPPKEREHP